MGQRGLQISLILKGRETSFIRTSYYVRKGLKSVLDVFVKCRAAGLFWGERVTL